MRASAFVYPWDVVGDPDAPGRLAALGVQQVTLASAYHSTRALTPRHPRHRIVTARHSAVLYPPDPVRWEGRRLRPYVQDWVVSDHEGGAYGEAAEALAEAGLDVHSWVVLAHNSRLGAEFPEVTVRNAYGDRYPWAPCAARAEVREYAVTLAAEAAVPPGGRTRGTELESCGWYGFAHLHAHDKTAGVALGGVGQYLMSLCFCDECSAGYAALGAEPESLRAAVTGALEPLWAGRRDQGAPGAAAREAELAGVEAALGAEPAAVFAAWRGTVAARFQREAVAAVRARAGADFRVLLHADPAPHRVGANAGVDPSDVLEHADGLVLPCAGGQGEGAAAERAAVLDPFAPHRREGSTLAANFTFVKGMGGSPGTLADDIRHAREHGATEVRLYHAGLASASDLSAAGAALAAVG
ncbi:hypothetical protein [Streptomyces daliensis]|uniref:Alanine-rich protein n=1 Tax=Streptomyces daliensis TaxID=299421 RepID=A0A8T4IS27_9ACTN|nr:hypothetical protein [Streptomyces daliensis]